MIYKLKYAKSESNFDSNFEHPTFQGVLLLELLGIQDMLLLELWGIQDMLFLELLGIQPVLKPLAKLELFMNCSDS